MRLVLIANPRSGAAPDPSELEALLAGGGAEVGYVPIDEISDERGDELEHGASTR